MKINKKSKMFLQATFLAVLCATSAKAAVVHADGNGSANSIYVGDLWSDKNGATGDGCEFNNGVYSVIDGVQTKLTVANNDEIYIDANGNDDYVEAINSTDGNLQVASSCFNGTGAGRVLQPITSRTGVHFLIDGDTGQDVIHGSDATDIIFGGPNFDTMAGRGGDDTLCGGSIGANACGTGANDCLFDADICNGEAGLDHAYCFSFNGGAGGSDHCPGTGGATACEIDDCP